jgi:hypothetical protein
MRIFFSDENLRRVLRRISLTRLVVFDMLILTALALAAESKKLLIGESADPLIVAAIHDTLRADA